MEAVDVDPINEASFTWPLTQDSIVVELGGYQGRWTLEMSRRYHSRIYTFEPQPWAYKKLRMVTIDLPNVKAFKTALGLGDGTFPMGSWGNDGCSFLKPEDGVAAMGEGEMRNISSMLGWLGLTHIDLMMMNIEGYEFPLIPYLFDTGLMPHAIERLVVQFHLFADPTGAQYYAIRQRIEQDYRILFDYGTTLVAWERK